MFLMPPLVKARQIDLSYISGGSSNSNLTTYTFAALSLGVAAPDRHILVLVSADQGAANIYTESVTVGGNAATLITRYNAATVSLSLYRIAVPNGTTADIVVNYGVVVGSCGIRVFRLVGAVDSVPYDSANTTTGSTAITFTRNVSANSVSLMGVAAEGTSGTTHTWSGTGLTSPFIATGTHGISRLSQARHAYEVAASGLTFTATFNSSPSIHRAVYMGWK